VNEPSASPFRLLFHPLVVCLLLAIATFTIYLPVAGYGFVDYDDFGYFFGNPHVLGGFTWDNVKWAFTSGEDANWHPLTWLTLMLDAQFFGKGAAAPHVTNIIIHLANAMLVFFWLRELTGAVWRSAAVAMLFAIHPLHVESVAWVAERKDVLSGFFGLLTLLCYARYVRTKDSQSHQRWIAYSLALFLFACGLMSKPMLVTLPFVLLLLDFWPLERFNPAALPRLLAEKVPFFVLCAVASVVTFCVQNNAGAVQTFTKVPVSVRVENAFVSYARYLAKTIYPVNLATPYPSIHYWPVWLAIITILLFIGLCIGVVLLREKYPYAFTGWFWFAGMLVPVIGLVQVGAQAMADRYMYLPILGIFIIIIWAAAEICLRNRAPRGIILSVLAFLFLVCAVRARNQVSVWQNDETLFGHALAVSENNYVASLDMGYWYSTQGMTSKTLGYYHDALRMAPKDPTALYNVGNALAKLGRWDEAIGDYRLAAQITPDKPDILNNLGFALAQTRQLNDAATCFEAVLKLEPNSVEAKNNLATIYFLIGRYADAAKQYQAALQLQPDSPRILINLGDTFVHMNNKASAAQCYQHVLQLQPDNAAVRSRLQSLGVQNPD
jgi:Flp pilus assembly protein TadD